MTERHFDEDLEILKEKVIKMGSVVEEMIQKGAQALISRNSHLPQEVFELERSVNQFHLDVDDLAIKLIALHQPMAIDLRLLMAALKINSDLERIGDLCVNFCQTAYYHLFKEPPVPEADLLKNMALIAQKMVKDSLDAFSRKDVDLARKVLDSDKEENHLKNEVLNILIDKVRKEPEYSKQFIDIILISRNLERIADHATNVAEDTIFMVLGKDIRHPKTRAAAGTSEVDS